eukprot:TRINITY_DN8524_c0_g1_i1.p1 TRINITY_DN8524_c0_g1~~TRINITY_DN8524_c0_g1_i1.p1  ORF type:complete len:372 (-),score=62.39 TRINITY_DN8524_c0_g1_i1:754-1818(-)
MDLGSGTIKAGLARDDAPRLVFPTIIGFDPEGYTSALGDEALQNQDLSLRYVIERGVVIDWDAIEQLCNHAYEQLLLSPQDQPILLTESYMAPRSQREKFFEMMFERFNVPAIYIAHQPELSLFASGRQTAMVLDSGEGVTHITAIYDGMVLPFSIQRSHFGGGDVTRHLGDMLNRHGGTFSTTRDWEAHLKGMKTKLTILSSGFETRLNEMQTMDWQLPDGKTIHVPAIDHFNTSEVIFRPTDFGYDSVLGVQQLLHQAIQSCDMDLRIQMLGNIVLSGGNTLFQGYRERLEEELGSLVPSVASKNIRIAASPERKYYVWIGGSILGSLSTFGQVWISQQEYQDGGVSVVHKS